MKASVYLKLFLAAAVTATLIFLASARVHGQSEGTQGRKAVIEGLVRDIACPIQNPAATATRFNLQCALDCAKKGSPLIIMTKNGDIYIPISSSMPDRDQRQRLLPFVGKFVQATGVVFARNGTRAIAITQIKELKNVHLNKNAS